jgi:oxygen-independent coproporphyrinogen-3 oxidase
VSSITCPGLYLHVPFCSAICPYCDFAVLVGDARRRRGFVEAVIAELSLCRGDDLPDIGGFDTIYLGGGTPSLLEPQQLAELLEAVEAEADCQAQPWIFLEANPEDVTAERVAAWVELGIKTVSLGVQSFDAEDLLFLGRAHSPAEARRSVELALGAGFATVSVDLIYGLPERPSASWRRQLETAAELGAQHLSCYQLTVHRKTVFGVRRRRGELAELPHDHQAELFRLTHRRLGELGFEGYEVSNFARAPEHRSRHNQKYWNHTPYLGVGPSAHSYSGRTRWWNHRHLSPWQAAVESGSRPVCEREELGQRDLALERLMLGLRTRAGVDLDELARRYGVDPRRSGQAILERFIESGELLIEGSRLRPTLEGLAIADRIARDLEI